MGIVPHSYQFKICEELSAINNVESFFKSKIRNMDLLLIVKCLFIIFITSKKNIVDVLVSTEYELAVTHSVTFANKIKQLVLNNFLDNFENTLSKQIGL